MKLTTALATTSQTRPHGIETTDSQIFSIESTTTNTPLGLTTQHSGDTV